MCISFVTKSHSCFRWRSEYEMPNSHLDSNFSSHILAAQRSRKLECVIDKHQAMGSCKHCEGSLNSLQFQDFCLSHEESHAPAVCWLRNCLARCGSRGQGVTWSTVQSRFQISCGRNLETRLSTVKMSQ